MAAGAALFLKGGSAPLGLPGAHAPVHAHLDSMGPRLISNQTHYPVTLYGSGFVPGMRLRVETPGGGGFGDG